MQPDPLVAVWAVIKSVTWLVFGPPLTLWNKDQFYCPFKCWSTAGTASILAWFVLVIIVYRLLDYHWVGDSNIDYEKWRVRAWIVTGCIFAFYHSMPAIYDGIAVMHHRAELENARLEREQRNRPPQPSRP